MPKKYAIYWKKNGFLFEEFLNGEKISKNHKEYKTIIRNFIHAGYTITYEDKFIILKSKRKFGKSSTVIVILNDTRVLNDKKFKELRKDIAKVKKAKGYNLTITDEEGNKIITKKPPTKAHKKRFSFFHSHIAPLGMALGILVLSISKINFGTLGKKDDVLEPYLLDSDSLVDDNSYAMLDENNKDISYNVSEIKEESEYDNYIKTYANYFHLDGEKVVEFARKVTNNYTLDFQDIIGTDNYDINSKEAACLIFVHELYNNNLAISLLDYGYSIDNFVLDSSITTLSPDHILANGQTFEQFFGHVCDLLQIDKYWLLGITYLETGRLTSNLAQNNNNFGGLRGSAGFYTYVSPEAGIIAHCRNLKRYEAFGFQNIYELAGTYVFGNAGLIYQIYENPNNANLLSCKATMDTWINSITWFHDGFVNNSQEIFGSEDIPEPAEMTLKREN